MGIEPFVETVGVYLIVVRPYLCRDRLREPIRVIRRIAKRQFPSAYVSENHVPPATRSPASSVRQLRPCLQNRKAASQSFGVRLRLELPSTRFLNLCRFLYLCPNQGWQIETK